MKFSTNCFFMPSSLHVAFYTLLLKNFLSQRYDTCSSIRSMFLVPIKQYLIISQQEKKNEVIIKLNETRIMFSPDIKHWCFNTHDMLCTDLAESVVLQPSSPSLCLPRPVSLLHRPVRGEWRGPAGDHHHPAVRGLAWRL